MRILHIIYNGSLDVTSKFRIAIWECLYPIITYLEYCINSLEPEQQSVMTVAPLACAFLADSTNSFVSPFNERIMTTSPFFDIL